MLRRTLAHVAVAAAIAMAVPACGKKGPPLAPLLRTPMPVRDLAVLRAGDTAYIRFTVPASNSDGTTPADIGRVEVYAYTATSEADGAVLTVRDLALVAEVAVRAPEDPGAATAARPAARQTAKDKQAADTGVEQGAVVTLTEVLTPETQVLTRLPKRHEPPAPPPAAGLPGMSTLARAVVGPVLEPRPRRYYAAFGVSRKGRRSGSSPRVALAFDVRPSPPGAPVPVMKDRAIELTWAPAADAARLPFEPAPTANAAMVPFESASAETKLLPATPRGMLLPVLPQYNVYLVPRAQAAAGVKPPEWPLPLNDRPLTEPRFTDAQVEFGTERCYVVRSVNTAGTASVLVSAATWPAPVALASVARIESAPSAPGCLVPVNRVPPPAPTALAAVASTGAISLIWTGVVAPDLAGYLVLRADAPDGKFVELFGTPIRETTYRDAAVAPGRRYVYVVVAVDASKPPNRSQPSNRAEETAR